MFTGQFNSGGEKGLLALSAAQQGVWIAQSLDPASPAFNLAEYIEITGSLDQRLFEAALRHVIAETDALQIRVVEFSESEDLRHSEVEPLLRLHPDPDWKLTVIDCSAESGAEAERLAEKWMKEDLARAVDLTNSAPFYYALLRVGPHRFFWYTRYHHLCIDGLSGALIARRVAEIYVALAEGRNISGGSFPPLSSLLEGETAYRASGQHQADAAYWRKLLADRPETVTLSGKPATSGRGFIRDTRFLSASLAESLHALAAAHGATLPQVMVAAVALYVYRMTGASDFLLGIPLSARIGREMRQIPGMVSNIVPVRIVLSGGEMPGGETESGTFRDGTFTGTLPETCDGTFAGTCGGTFKDLLRQVSSQMREALRHQRYPMAMMRRDLGLNPQEPDVYAAVVNVMSFAYGLQFAGRAARPRNLSNGPVADLSFVVYDRRDDSGLQIDLDANPGNYASDRLTAHLKRFVRMLMSLAEAEADVMDRPLHKIVVVCGEERRALLDDFNATAQTVPQATLPRLFEEQVERTPGAVALMAGRESLANAELTYAELNERSNRLARYLIRLGAGPEKFVGIFLERQAAMLVAMLAVLKSGAAYLPLDPDYPAARLEGMLQDAAPVLVLSSRALSPRLTSASRVIQLDAPEIVAALDTVGANNLAESERISPLLPSHPAYVIYTSGSSGRPKGVVIEHRNTAAFAAWARSRFTAEEWAGVLAGTSICFDLSVFELIVPLTFGGTVILASSPVNLPDPSTARNIRLMNTVPSAARALLDSGNLPANLININLAGESLPGSLVRSLYQTTGVKKVYNLYGPSETTTYSTAALCGNDPLPAQEPSIGGPIWNTQAYVLDRFLEPLPIGATGELYISGLGLARGYLNRPPLTAERFIASPYGAAGSRMYRTGDLARWRSDGEMEFLGRSDQQVKIRGFRIELGEIEAALSAEPDVAQALVVAREDSGRDGGSEGKRLVAYLVLKVGAALNGAGARQGQSLPYEYEEHLRASLRRRLPEYMVPAAFVLLDALPQTPNGKVDRRALPAPQGPRQEYRAPQTPEERFLCEQFAELLSSERVGVRVGIEDHFFHLGGHSLTAMRLVARLRSAFGVEIGLKQIFDAPTVSQLASFVQKAKRAGEKLEQAERADRTGPLPLSYAQQQLWFLYRMEGASFTYNIPLALRLQGELDVAVLKEALADVVGRHEILRTVFPEIDGIPYQKVFSFAEARLAIHEESVDEANLAPRLAAAISTTFELSCEIPLRVWLFRLQPQSHALLFLVHHIAGDAWSLGLLARDFSAAYSARKREAKPDLVPLPFQYADFARWQRKSLGDDHDPNTRLGRQMAFWRRALAGAPEELNLPADRRRPVTPSYRGAIIPVQIEAQLHRAFLQLARSSGASLFMVLQSAFAATLSRLGAGDDIPTGTPVAGRGDRNLDDLIGLFVNTLVMRTDVSEVPSFNQLVARVRTFALEAYENQDLPFERLVDALQPTRSLSRHPLFQVMLVLQNAPERRLELPGVAAKQEPIAENVAKFDLTLVLAERLGVFGAPEGIQGGLEYSLDLFDEQTAAMIAGCFLQFIREAVKHPEVALHSLDLLSEEAQRQIIEDFNAPAALVGIPMERLAAKTVVAMFEEQATRTPEAVALLLAGSEQFLTYRELNGYANRLAYELIERGVAPEKLVGICFDRSLEMVVALLATWKAGGAFLPLDPEYPEARLADIIEDSAPLIVITNQALQSRLPRSLLQSDDSATASAAPSSSFQLISLDSLAYFENRSEINVKSTLTPRHSAYVIYTSGTTGKPKGVVVEHASLATKIRGITAQLNIGPATRFAVMTSLSFDPLLEDLLCPICAGGAAVLVPNEIRQDPQLFANEASRLNLTIVNGSPRLIERLFPEGKFSVRLDALIVGGDVFPPVLADRLLQGGCARRILNFYGPTEATIDAAAYELTGTSAEHRWETIPIGKPLPTYRIYILDCHLQPLPVGVTGDLYIAGACLARGYLNRPALTTERFVADPFSSVGGTRMYRTGDRARWLRDGLLEFAGRVDEQVKIRGFRVELGEIEAALQNQEEIDHAAVVVHEQEPGRKQLVAYITAANGQIPADAALRNRLSKRLPEHMVPSAFVVLDALPLTPNGKLDRAALPAPPGSSRIRRAPRTWEEEILSRSIAELLSLKQVGVEDNFFHLGGDSILSIQLVSRARPAGLQITPRDIFQQQTVEGIASVAVRIAQSLPAPGLSPSEHASFEQAPLEHGVDLLALSSEQRRSLEAKYPGLESILPLSPLQEGLLFHTLYDQSSPDIYTVQLGVEFEGPLEGALMKRAAESMLRRYPNLRVSICHEGLARAAQVVPSKVDLHWVEVDLSGEGSAKRESRYASLLESDRNRPFDLEHGPLLRFSWVEMGMGKNRLIFTNHHVLMDGWSLPIFFKELLELYRLEALYRFEALYRPEQAVGAEEKAVELPPVRPYSDYLQWLSRQDQQASLQLWKEYLSGLEGGTRLAKPEDRKRTSSFRQWESDLPSAITHRLQAVARELGLTLSTVVQGLWALLLTRFAGREEVVFGVTVSGRPAELVGVEYMIGLFINTLPVRVKVRAEEPLRAMLGRMQESHAALLSVQNVGLAEIQKAAGQGDLFDTIVVFENYPLDRSELNEPLPGVRVTRIEAFEQTHYPLSLTVIPGVKPSSGISGINDAPDNGDGSEATLQVRLEFDLARIGEEIADAMGKGLMRMLHGFAENPETPVCCLDILDTQAREQILKEFNAAANSYVHSSPQVTETQVAKTQTLETRTTHKTVVELFEEQVARTPDATALLLAGSSESLTYREVNDRANLLARDLFGHGVGPEKLVGICLDRTPEMVIALLAVLKSGGAFLPLEPEYPVARLADIIEDAAPVVVIGGEALQSQLQQESQSSRSTSTRLGSIKVIRVHFSSSHKIDPEMNPKPHLKDLHPAYVIYTSGTTGRPKGVVVSHASLANKIASLGKYLGITSETRYSVITSLSFDPLLAQVLCPLCFGAACMLVPGHIREDAHAFAEEARRLNLSILDVSPRLAGALLPEGKLPLRLEALVFGGETLPPALANKLLKAEAAARILNLYGPTEVCIDATAHELNESNESIDESAGETVPIGKPLPNYRAYVLDRWLDPLPVGVTGELFLAGVGLARGYLNRPALTAGSFVANPFGHGERMYRTGDLARWRPDGVLEFAGRADQQLKIRG
ncbi:MAG TPA: amino acid adenylation domain-containing protein, partial [Candidatus Angelobacter sp.]|nr:amino acid adenylation domain-containing protein [Candidatus Angelobacter sp.]